MKALITGASSGIGYEMAIYLSKKGYDIIAIAQDEERLKKLKENCITNVDIVISNLTDEAKSKEIYQKFSNEDIEIVVNNAGFGEIGKFYLQDLDNELNMINLNIKAVHILTKLFLNDMIKKDKGYILNVASSAAFLPGGPLMATYYATKSYVLNLTCGISKELKKENSKVYVGVLCPGPVKTKFNEKLNIKYSVKPASANYVAKYTIDKMFKRKAIIVPTLKAKLGVFLTKILPQNILLNYIYNMQAKKIK